MTHRFLLLFLIALGNLASPVLADTLYRYQNPDGSWTFTDKQIPGETAASVSKMATFDDSPNTGNYGARIDQRKEGLFVLAYNNLGGPVHFEFRYRGEAPLAIDPPLPLNQTLEAGTEMTLLEFTAPPLSLKGLGFRATLGKPGVQHRPEGPYRLPFLPGDRYRISQGFNGAFSHNHPGSQYAVDIAMPEGSLICAARSGTVMAVEHGNYQGGADPKKFLRKANLVRILHKDGTIATYAHLQMETVVVDIGDQVEAGQLIGRSGNTGFSTGPHLHFVIQKNDGRGLRSVPFQFTSGTPQKGQVLSFDE